MTEPTRDSVAEMYEQTLSDLAKARGPSSYTKRFTKQSFAEARVRKRKPRHNHWAQEGFILSVSEAVWEEMGRQGITLTQLADRMGRCRSHLSRMLRGDRNMTLRNCADIFAALDKEVKIKAIPLTKMPMSGGQGG